MQSFTFINSELLKASFVEDESQVEDSKSHRYKRDIGECKLECFSFEVTKENINECMKENQ
jgi:hypothetical protein